MTANVDRSRLRKSLLGLVAAGVLIALALLLRRQAEVPDDTAQSASYRLLYPYTLWTAEEAIQLSLEEFPEGKNPHSPVARLITMDDLDAWSGWGSADETGQPILSGAPVWLVGILGDGLIVDDIAPSPYGDTTPMEGVYYAWDANAGHMAASGGLMQGTQGTYASIVAMQNRDLIIAPATPQPTPDTSVTSTPLPPGMYP